MREAMFPYQDTQPEETHTSEKNIQISDNKKVESARAWVDLTDDEMLMIYMQPHEGFKYSLGRMVQALLKEKNS
jgi:hypothetical protein